MDHSGQGISINRGYTVLPVEVLTCRREHEDRTGYFVRLTQLSSKRRAVLCGLTNRKSEEDDSAKVVA